MIGARVRARIRARVWVRARIRERVKVSTFILSKSPRQLTGIYRNLG
jgi:hypothetical protein